MIDVASYYLFNSKMVQADPLAVNCFWWVVKWAQVLTFKKIVHDQNTKISKQGEGDVTKMLTYMTSLVSKITFCEIPFEA